MEFRGFILFGIILFVTVNGIISIVDAKVIKDEIEQEGLKKSIEARYDLQLPLQLEHEFNDIVNNEKIDNSNFL